MRNDTTRRHVLGTLTALSALGLVAGCTNLVPGQGPPPTIYRLTPKSTFREDLPKVDWQLVLEAPLANAGLNTPRIGLMRKPTQLEYYARASWADRAPLMVQTLMVESFENSGKIIAVGREAVGLRSDYVLKTELREFQVLYYEGPKPVTDVAINAKLVRMPSREIIGSKSFSAQVEAAADGMDEIIPAIDQALGTVLKQLVEWTLLTGEEAYTPPSS